MTFSTFSKSFLLLTLITLLTSLNIYAGEYPRTLTAYRGTTPVLDGFISEGEYSDAEWITGVSGWHSDTDNNKACEDSLDLSVKIWYKHDGTYLYFAFDVTDNVIYGTDTLWLPDANPEANNLARGEGWPWFGDGLEIMMNSTYTWDETKKSIGDGTIWQTIVSNHKSYAGGMEYGGLIQGVPYTEYAWTNYENWYANEHMKASIRVKTEEEGSGYVVEWRISPNPCMQIDETSFVDLSKESKVGINIEFEDLDNPDEGLGTNVNLAQFRHVDYMAKLEDYRKNIAKGFATLLMTPGKMNPDNLETSISEDYEASLDTPSSHNLVPGPGNDISVQYGLCGNNNLVLDKNSATDSIQASVSFLWMDNTLNSSFDITPKQTDCNIHFDLVSEGKTVVMISFEDDSIRYYQNGSPTAWKSYEADTKYRIQIMADMQNNKYSLDINGDMLQDLDYQDSTGAPVNSFMIQSQAASTGSFEFDNLIIQEDPIESSDFYSFENCWDLKYDYEGSLVVPENHTISAENSTDVSVNYSAICENNSLHILDTSTISSTQVEVQFDSVTDIVHVQFTLDAAQDTSSVDINLRDADKSIVTVGLNSNGMLRYNDMGSFVDWKSYTVDAKYSLQIIASNRMKKYDLIVNSDTMSQIGFSDSTGTLIDNMTISSSVLSVGVITIDNLVLSNQVLSDLVFPFDTCVELMPDPTNIEKLDAELYLFPNPTFGFLTIESALSHPNPIIVTDLYGREIYQINGSRDNKIEIDLSDLAPGLYIIHFDTEYGRISRKIQLIK